MSGIPIQGFVGPSYTDISKSINAQRLVNMRLELDSGNGKSPLALVGLPGYRAVITDLPAGEVRGFWSTAKRTFFVIGGTLYELHSDMTHDERGYLTTTTGRVSMADNGIHLAVVDGIGLLLLKLDDNSTQTTVSGFPYGTPLILVTDSTGIAFEPGTQRFHFSAVGDLTSWQAISFSSVEGFSDNLVSQIVFNRKIFFLGTGSIQPYWDSAEDATNPFAPIQGSIVEVGCIAPFSVSKDETGVYWLGNDPRGGPRVYKYAGDASPSVISPPFLDVQLRKYASQSTLTDAFGYNFRMDGHIFYVLTFPSLDRTWLFDATSEAWQEFSEWDTDWHRHRSNCAIYAFGKQLIGDFENGVIYEMHPDIYQNDGRVLRALRSTSHISQNQEAFVPGCIEVVCETGVGLEDGSDPQMMLRVSKDGGNKWLPEMVRSMGKVGEYKKRVRFNRPCGVVRDMVVEVSITDPVKRIILSGVMNGL